MRFLSETFFTAITVVIPYMQMDASRVFFQVIHGSEPTITMATRMLFRFGMSYPNMRLQIGICDEFFLTKGTCERPYHIRMRLQMILQSIGGKIFVAQCAETFAISNVLWIDFR